MGKGKGKGNQGKKSRKHKKKRDDKPTGPPMAERADPFALYQLSVQEPSVDLEFMAEAFKERYDREPRQLREDFCAAAHTACTWVTMHPENTAVGVDLDPAPLNWGRENNVVQLDDDQAKRLRLVEGNVLDGDHDKVDIIAAQNFSYFIFKTREALREYFEAARKGLRKQGIFVLDIFGGPESQMICEEETENEEEGFTYIWRQDHYNPIQNGIRCAIDFSFPDGSRIRDAFTYDWRMWTIQEVCELLREAGFKSADAYWEGADEDGEGNGIFERQEDVANEDAWIAYIVGSL